MINLISRSKEKNKTKQQWRAPQKKYANKKAQLFGNKMALLATIYNEETNLKLQLPRSQQKPEYFI